MKVVLLHVPKTAGVSIIKTYENQGLIGWGHNIRSKNYTPYPDSRLALARKWMPFIAKKMIFVFSVVRNPWARTYSAYRYLSKGGIWIEDKRDSKTYLSPFNNFDDFVRRGLVTAAREQLHFLPQVYWIQDKKGRNLTDRIIYLENIDNELPQLIEQVGYTATPLAKKNTSGLNDYKSHYTDETIEIVSKVYESDIINFGYTY